MTQQPEVTVGLQTTVIDCLKDRIRQLEATVKSYQDHSMELSRFEDTIKLYFETREKLLEAKLEKAKAALEFYGAKGNWHGGAGFPFAVEIQPDDWEDRNPDNSEEGCWGGKLARKTLGELG